MKKPMMLAALISVTMFSGSALAAVQDADQQKCIMALNKGMTKVATTEFKAMEKCLKSYQYTAGVNFVDCYNTATSVDDARTKTCEAEESKCTTAPDFGKTSCSTANDYAEIMAYMFALDLFGNPNANAVCAEDKAECTCEAKTLKAASKLYVTSLKSFNLCKRVGLATFTDATQLTTCIGADPSGLDETAETKLAATIMKTCSGTVDPFSGGDCEGLNGTALADCLAAVVRCRVCLTVTTADNLTFDCDTFDDGASNNSCYDDNPF